MSDPSRAGICLAALQHSQCSDENALRPLGVRRHMMQTPLTPDRVWQFIQTRSN